MTRRRSGAREGPLTPLFIATAALRRVVHQADRLGGGGVSGGLRHLIPLPCANRVLGDAQTLQVEVAEPDHGERSAAARRFLVPGAGLRVVLRDAASVLVHVAEVGERIDLP